MEYYRWSALPFRMAPLSGKVHGYPLELFSDFLDVLFTLADVNNGLQPKFIKPANLMVIQYKENIILGLNYSKAIAGMCSVHELYNCDIPQMKFWAGEVLGFPVETVLSIPQQIVDKYIQPFSDTLKSLRNNNFSFEQQHQKIFSFLKDDSLKALVDKMNKDITIKTEGERYMFINPIFDARNIKVDDNLCFLVMPFNKQRKDLLENVVKPKVEKECGLNVLKSGDIQEPNQKIMENIWTYINQSYVVIADISDKNPNVFYEIGICHTLGKPVILLCDEESRDKDYDGEVPFDISGLFVNFYHNSGSGPNQLAETVVKAISNLRKKEY